MRRYYSRATGCTYLSGIHGASMPADAILISEDQYLQVIANPVPGKIRSHDAAGLPILVDPAPHVFDSEVLCASIDIAADSARRSVAGDPLRAVEYDRARLDAEAFAAAGYQGDVPPMVAAWAINARTAQEAADDILREAAQYTAALVQLREVRLAGKEQIRSLMAEGEVEQAQEMAAQTIAAIQAAVDGVGNAR